MNQAGPNIRRAARDGPDPNRTGSAKRRREASVRRLRWMAKNPLLRPRVKIVPADRGAVVVAVAADGAKEKKVSAVKRARRESVRVKASGAKALRANGRGVNVPSVRNELLVPSVANAVSLGQNRRRAMP